MSNDFLRLLAAWALIHETADEGWKAAVGRGQTAGPTGMQGGPDAFVDGLSALVAQEKDKMKAELRGGKLSLSSSSAPPGEWLDELRFELGQIRGRLESLETAVDGLKGCLENQATPVPGEGRRGSR